MGIGDIASLPNAATTALGVTIFKSEDLMKSKDALIPYLVELSSKSELKSYGPQQWDFLLQAGDVSAIVFHAASSECGTDEPPVMIGSVLRIVYGEHTSYGRLLVSPQARGQGLARSLLGVAMALPTQFPGIDGMKILGNCTEMGRPLYEKMGFQRVSSVRRMTAALGDIRFQVAEQSENENNLTVQISDTMSPLLGDILAMDAKATGLDRSQTLIAVQSYPYVSTITITDTQGKIAIAAMLTRHTNLGIATVGPILGQESLVPLLLQTVHNHCCCDGTTKEMTMVLADHESLAVSLLDAGFQMVYELAAMTMLGGALPGDRDMYLGLIHPTLG